MPVSQIRSGFSLVDGVLTPNAETMRDGLATVLHARVRSAEGEAADYPGFDIIVTTESVDSYGDVVLASACDWTRFDTNPVITPQHETDKPGIARCVKRWPVEARVERNGVMVKGWAQRWEFNVAKSPGEDDEIQQTARSYLNAYRAKFMRAASIHFVPKKDGYRTACSMTLEERLKYGLTSEYGILWTDVLILSVGCVTIPANEQSLMLSAGQRAARGACTDAEVKALRTELHALRDEVTELRSLVQAKPDATPAAPVPAKAATDAEGGTNEGANGERAAGAAKSAPAGGLSPDQIAAFAARALA